MKYTVMVTTRRVVSTFHKINASTDAEAIAMAEHSVKPMEKLHDAFVAVDSTHGKIVSRFVCEEERDQ